jgi:hypothetical protein
MAAVGDNPAIRRGYQASDFDHHQTVVIESYLQKPADESGLTNPLERLALVTI